MASQLLNLSDAQALLLIDTENQLTFSSYLLLYM